MTQLYQIKLTSSIQGLHHKTEYLRCKSLKILDEMFQKCFTLRGSMYFGYDHVEIKKMGLNNFPEVKTLNISLKKSKKNKITKPGMTQ